MTGRLTMEKVFPTKHSFWVELAKITNSETFTLKLFRLIATMHDYSIHTSWSRWFSLCQHERGGWRAEDETARGVLLTSLLLPSGRSGGRPQRLLGLNERVIRLPKATGSTGKGEERDTYGQELGERVRERKRETHILMAIFCLPTYLKV